MIRILIPVVNKRYHQLKATAYIGQRLQAGNKAQRHIRVNTNRIIDIQTHLQYPR